MRHAGLRGLASVLVPELSVEWLDSHEPFQIPLVRQAG